MLRECLEILVNWRSFCMRRSLGVVSDSKSITTTNHCGKQLRLGIKYIYVFNLFESSS
jgi:hypothetical protein